MPATSAGTTSSTDVSDWWPGSPPRAGRCAGPVGDLDVDRERRESLAAVHRHMDLFRVDRDVPAHDGENLLVQRRDQRGLAHHPAFVLEQDLQPLARHRGGADRLEKTEQLHAALRPKSLLNNPFFSVGIIISITSPPSRRAASV